MRSSTSSPQAREDARAPREAPGAQAAQRRAQTPEAGEIASDLRAVLSTLIRRLRAENRFPLAHAAVLSRLEREGERCVSELAAAERVRPQSMAQTVADLEAEGLVQRRPDPADRRRAPPAGGVACAGDQLLALRARAQGACGSARAAAAHRRQLSRARGSAGPCPECSLLAHAGAPRRC